MDVEELVDVVNLKKLFVGNLPFTCTKENSKDLYSQVQPGFTLFAFFLIAFFLFALLPFTLIAFFTLFTSLHSSLSYPPRFTTCRPSLSPLPLAFCFACLFALHTVSEGYSPW
jgi:hypothetical protein